MKRRPTDFLIQETRRQLAAEVRSLEFANFVTTERAAFWRREFQHERAHSRFLVVKLATVERELIALRGSGPRLADDSIRATG